MIKVEITLRGPIASGKSTAMDAMVNSLREHFVVTGFTGIGGGQNTLYHEFYITLKEPQANANNL